MRAKLLYDEVPSLIPCVNLTPKASVCYMNAAGRMQPRMGSDVRQHTARVRRV